MPVWDLWIVTRPIWNCLFVWWCLTPLSTIFGYIVAVSFIGGGNRMTAEKTTDLSQVTDKLYHIMLYTLPWSRFEFPTLVVIGTDCIGSCKRRPLALEVLLSMLLLFYFFFVIIPQSLCLYCSCFRIPRSLIILSY